MTKDFIRSRAFKNIIIGFLAAIAILVVFRLGMIVGFKEASFSYQWGDNYYHNFAGPRPGVLGELAPSHEFMESHGTFGTIVKIDPTDIIVTDQNETEKIVEVSTSTIMKDRQASVVLSDLKPNDSVVIIGEPDASGTINAKLIRVLPTNPAPIGSNNQ